MVMVEDVEKRVTIKEIMAFGFSREEAENIYNGKNPNGSDFVEVEVPW